MPELPEVETVMRGMQIALQNRTIEAVKVYRFDLRWQIPADFSARITGKKILSFMRRGKYIFIRLSEDLSIVLHLGMSGRIVLDSSTVPAKHEHIVFMTDDGKRCGFIDPRRFGSVDLINTSDEATYARTQGMGPEPLTPAFTPQILAESLSGKTSPIKTGLLDQSVVAGLGNIYVCEALFRARLDPRTPAKNLKKTDFQNLIVAIRAVLTEAIAVGGSSLKDYVRPEGELGYFQHAWKVYGREGEPCTECASHPACAGVTRISQSGRSTFFCPTKQKLR